MDETLFRLFFIVPSPTLIELFMTKRNGIQIIIVSLQVGFLSQKEGCNHRNNRSLFNYMI